MEISFSKPAGLGHPGTQIFLSQMQEEVCEALRLPSDQLRGVFLQQAEDDEDLGTAFFLVNPPEADEFVHQINIHAQFMDTILTPLPMGVNIKGAKSVGPLPLAVAHVFEKALAYVSTDLMLTTELLQVAELEKENILEGARLEKESSEAARHTPSKTKMYDQQTQTRTQLQTHTAAHSTDEPKSLNKGHTASTAVKSQELRQNALPDISHIVPLPATEAAPLVPASSRHLSSARGKGREQETEQLTKTSGDEVPLPSVRDHIQTSDIQKPHPVIEFSIRNSVKRYDAGAENGGAENTNPPTESPTPWKQSTWTPVEARRKSPTRTNELGQSQKDEVERVTSALRLIQDSRDSAMESPTQSLPLTSRGSSPSREPDAEQIFGTPIKKTSSAISIMDHVPQSVTPSASSAEEEEASSDEEQDEQERINVGHRIDRLLARNMAYSRPSSHVVHGPGLSEDTESPVVRLSSPNPRFQHLQILSQLDARYNRRPDKVDT